MAYDDRQTNRLDPLLHMSVQGNKSTRYNYNIIVYYYMVSLALRSHRQVYIIIGKVMNLAYYDSYQ